MNEEAILEQVELDEDFEVEGDELVGKEFRESENPEMPEFASPEWTEYILSLLTEDEKVKDKPRTEGLIRITRMLFDEVEFPNPQVHHVNEGYAAVTAAILVNGRQYVGSAEVHAENTDAPYNRYPLATAETRALGRAVKRFLCLNVITAEETSRVADLTIPKSDEDRTEGSITSTQIKTMERHCKSLDLDVKRVVVSVVGEHDKINDLSHAEALQVLKQVDEWKRNPPEENLGPFSTDWKSNFN